MLLDLSDVARDLAHVLLTDVLILMAMPEDVLSIGTRALALRVIALIRTNQLGLQQAVRRADAPRENSLQNAALFAVQTLTATVLFFLTRMQQSEGSLIVDPRGNLSKVLPWVAVLSTGVGNSLSQVIEHNISG